MSRRTASHEISYVRPGSWIQCHYRLCSLVSLLHRTYVNLHSFYVQTLVPVFYSFPYMRILLDSFSPVLLPKGIKFALNVLGFYFIEDGTNFLLARLLDIQWLANVFNSNFFLSQTYYESVCTRQFEGLLTLRRVDIYGTRNWICKNVCKMQEYVKYSSRDARRI